MKKRLIEYYVDENDCHICTSHSKSKGYPFISVNGEKVAMSRYIFTKHFGEIPKGLLVRHTCDNRGCINPEHLLLGTYADNARDMTTRNRQAKGEKVSTARLTRSDVEEILMYPHTVGNAEIAKKYKVNALNISRIRRGIIWKSVPRPNNYYYIEGHFGETNGSSKLSEDIVIEILRDTSLSYSALAKKFDVAQSTISNIKAGKTWKHISQRISTQL